MLVDLTRMEQRYDAVMKVKQGRTVAEVARHLGVSRQSLHAWMKRYDEGGMASLADRSRRPHHSPAQMPAAIEALVLELRDRHGWGERRIHYELARRGVSPMPGRSSIYRALVRNDRVASRRRRDRSHFRSWERSAPMALWQGDIMRRVFLQDGTEIHVVNFIDDHSRFCVASVPALRATSRAVCEAFLQAISRYGGPDEVLTDNGIQFTGRFRPNHGETMFDRICRERAIDHILTSVRSPTTTGKIERFHQTLRRELFERKVFVTLEEVRVALAAFADTYNNQRPHRSLAMRPPAERFGRRQPSTTLTRRVSVNGTIMVAYQVIIVGRGLAGEIVEIVLRNRFLEVMRNGQIIRTVARPAKEVRKRRHQKVSRMS